MVWTSGNIILGIVDCSFIEVRTTGNNLKALFDKIENLIRFDFLKFDQKLFLIHFFFFFLFFFRLERSDAKKFYNRNRDKQSEFSVNITLAILITCIIFFRKFVIILNF